MIGSHRESGFTLIELVVAIAVFAIMSTIAYAGLNSMINQQTQMQSRMDKLKSLQLTLKFLERDIQQLANRPIRDQFGDAQPAMTGDGESIMSFTYSGWRNPAGLSRSAMQRVSYEFTDEQLVRHTWPRLDGATLESVQTSTLLEDVEELELRFLNNLDDWEERWPPLNATAQTASLPRAVSIEFVVQPWGTIKRIIPLAN